MKLVLIDGNAIMHRAFHAIPPLNTKKGKPTNAVYGFASMLLNTVKRLEPTHLIVCFDRKEPTFRKTMYVGYQAHRPKMDDKLAEQFSTIKQVLKAMDVPIYELAGYEADDVIGTLTHQALRLGGKPRINSHSARQFRKEIDVIVVTGDRDILQLVNRHTKIYMPVKGLANAELYGEEKVKEKYGIAPSQIVDYKALAGDASDNYPGVRGIGPKTACDLLNRFGTLENLYRAIKNKEKCAQELRQKTIQALSIYAGDAEMAKKLAKIVTDVPVTLDMKKAKLHEFNTSKVQKLFMELGFFSLIKRLNNREINVTKEQRSSKLKPTAGKLEQKPGEQLALV